MSKTRILRAARLQMFNEGGAAAATGTDGASAESSAQVEERQPIKYEPKNKRGKNSGNKADLSTVVYGKQAAAEPAPEDSGNTDPLAKDRKEVTTTSNTLEAKKAAFEELINGEYKDLYTEKFQEAFNRRFKEAKNNEARLGEIKPVLDMLNQRYGIADGDIKKLTEAIETDDKYWEEAAEEAGLTVEQYKRMQKLEREHADMLKARRQQEAMQAADRQASAWQREADAVRQQYPQFDLAAEMQNDQFRKLLLSGIPVKHAYETMHLDELVSGAAIRAAQQAEERTVSKVKSRASRPAENGTSSQSTPIVKSDVSKLTAKDRAEIARRVARGERIEF